MSENFEVVNYDNIYLCHYITTKLICSKKIKEHSLIYVKTGILELVYNNEKYIFKAGESVFVKRSLEIYLTKLLDGDIPFSGIFFILDDEFLKTQASKYKINDEDKMLDSIIKIENNQLMNTFFQTFIDYMDNNIVLSNEIIKAKKVDLEEFMKNNYKENLSLDVFI